MFVNLGVCEIVLVISNSSDYDFTEVKVINSFRLLSYRNQSIGLQSKLMYWYLYDNGLHHERVKLPKF